MVRKEEWATGSYTVEAALIMPIIIFIILAIFYMTFYMHDLVRINQILDRAAKKENGIIKHIADYETGTIKYEKINERGVFYLLLSSFENETSILTDSLEEELKRGLFITKIEEVEAKVDGKKIKIIIKFSRNISLFGVRKFFQTINRGTKIEEEYLVYHPTEFIRAYEALNSTMDELEGYKKIKEKLKKLLKILN